MKAVRWLVGLAATGLIGCTQVTSISDAQGLPYIAVFRPPPPGEETILLTAGLDSRIWIDRDCVLLGNERAGYSLPLFYPGTVVGRDGRGLYLEDPETRVRFRDGERVLGGGGVNPSKGSKLDRLLAQPVPNKCLQRTDGTAGSVNPGLRRPGMPRE